MMFPVATSSSSSSLSRAVQQNYKQRTIERNDQSSVVRRTFINHRTKRDQSRQRVVEQKAAFKYPDLDTFLILSLFLTRASETDEHKTSLLASMVVMPGICVRWCLSHRGMFVQCVFIVAILPPLLLLFASLYSLFYREICLLLYYNN
jgi:hypothetical protein